MYSAEAIELADKLTDEFRREVLLAALARAGRLPVSRDDIWKAYELVVRRHAEQSGDLEEANG